MRDNLNFNMLPIVQDNMSCVPAVGTYANISSNGYYGYQPPLLERRKDEDVSVCLMEVQFENSNQTGNRKRSWEFSNDFREFKKRRQNEFPAPSKRDPISRKPTHNTPDMPRCIMEKIRVNVKKKINRAEEELLEELLNATHGCSIYHWNNSGDFL